MSTGLITKKQKQVLDFVTKYELKRGYSPSLEEIAQKLGLSSASTAHYHVAKLRQTGLLLNEANKKDRDVLAIATSSIERPIEDFINKVFEADCLDIMPLIPDKSIDLILCDLPYGTTQNHWDSVIPLNDLWRQYERIIKDNGAIVLTGQGIFTAKLILSNEKLFKYKNIWVKSKPTNFLNAKKQPLRKHEDICIFYKKQPVYNPQMTPGLPYHKGTRKNQLTGSYGEFNPIEVKSLNGERYPTDVVYFKTAESEGPVYHPTQKPVELARYYIKTFTKPGAIVLDNAAGSGSFLVAAAMEGRNYIGIEKNQEVYLHRKHRINYINVIHERLSSVNSRLELED